MGIDPNPRFNFGPKKPESLGQPLSDMEKIGRDIVKRERREMQKFRTKASTIALKMDVHNVDTNSRTLSQIDKDINILIPRTKKAITELLTLQGMFHKEIFSKEDPKAILANIQKLDLNFMSDLEKDSFIKIVKLELKGDRENSTYREYFYAYFGDRIKQFQEDLSFIEAEKAKLDKVYAASTKGEAGEVDSPKNPTEKPKTKKTTAQKPKETSKGSKSLDSVEVYANTYALNASQEMRHVFAAKENRDFGDHILVKTMINELNKNGYKLSTDNLRELRDSKIVKMIGAYQKLKGIKVDGKFGPQTFAKLKGDLPKGVELVMRGASEAEKDMKLSKVLKRNKGYYNAVPRRVRRAKGERVRRSNESLSKYARLDKQYKAYKELLGDVKSKLLELSEGDKPLNEAQLRLNLDIDLSIGKLRKINSYPKKTAVPYDGLDSFLISQKVLKSQDLISEANKLGVKVPDIFMKSAVEAAKAKVESARKVAGLKLDSIQKPDEAMIKKFGLLDGQKLVIKDFDVCAELIKTCSEDPTAQNIDKLNLFLRGKNGQPNFLPLFKLSNPIFGQTLNSILEQNPAVSDGVDAKVKEGIKQPVDDIKKKFDVGTDEVNLSEYIKKDSLGYEDTPYKMVDKLVENKDVVLKRLKEDKDFKSDLNKFYNLLDKSGFPSEASRLKGVLIEAGMIAKEEEVPAEENMSKDMGSTPTNMSSDMSSDQDAGYPADMNSNLDGGYTPADMGSDQDAGNSQVDMSSDDGNMSTPDMGNDSIEKSNKSYDPASFGEQEG